MSRLRRIAECERFFFITTNVSRNVPFLRPHEMDLVLDVLDNVRRGSGFPLLGYVVMPDHCHLLFETRRESLPHIMHQWKFKSGYSVQMRRHHSGAFRQPRYFDFICRRSRDVSDKLYYIHQNPVVEKLVTLPEDWTWSSAAFYLKKGHSRIQPDLVSFSGDPNQLLWPPPNRM
jgi:REP-associated tyrosine transposase